MKRYVPEEMTSIERQVHAQQVRDKGCAVCAHRGERIEGWGLTRWTCEKGLVKRGRCHGFRLDEGGR